MTTAHKDWIGYWNGTPTVYVCDRHKAIHYQDVADGIARHVPDGAARVLDFGCGEALAADGLAAKCGTLYLADAAPSVREGLERRFADVPAIAVIAPEQMAEAIAPGSLDLIVVNSVAQYLQPEDLGRNIERWTPLLRDGGRILFADIIPPDVSPVADASALLGFAARRGFIAMAVIGLIRTYFSGYRGVRERLGFTQYREQDFLALARAHGFVAERVHPNLGHNQRRMAFLAQRHV